MPGEQAAATASMGITHGALRRDLARIRTTLTAAPYPQGRQRAAIAAHAGSVSVPGSSSRCGLRRRCRLASACRMIVSGHALGCRPSNRCAA